jgi:hypothetical protein
LESIDWKLVDRRFEVPSGKEAGKGLQRVTLVRTAAWKFDNKVDGTLWIDGVSIREAGK